MSDDLFGPRPPKPKREPNEVWQIAHLFATMWEEKYTGEEYVIQKADLKWAVELKGRPRDEIVKRAKVYFQNTYHAQHRHQFRSFVKNYNSFIIAVTPTRRPDSASAPLKEATTCTDCGAALVDGLCPSCFPVCETCKGRHAKELTCQEHQAAQRWLAATMGGNLPRGETRSIAEVLSSNLRGRSR
jgi:hypothetical protein